MAWLFLFGFLLWAVAAAMFFYAGWNARGLRGGLRLLEVSSSELSPVSEIPERDFRDAPLPAPLFERDTIRVELAIAVSDGRARGPARFAAGIGASALEAGTGLVPREGWTAIREYGPVARGPIAAERLALESSDPLGFFRSREALPSEALTVALPLFTSFSDRVKVREVESQLTVVRAGHGTDLYGVREYRPGDPLRRIHWKTSARRGELVVREFEPPGLRVLGLHLDPEPESQAAADQLARLAASEAWDCLRAGGRVVGFSAGLEPLRLEDGRSIWRILEWLARWPYLPPSDAEPPRVLDAIGFTDRPEGPVIDALSDLRDHGASVRAWIVGAGELDLPHTTAGLEWPLAE